jgi:hypothetical protein
MVFVDEKSNKRGWDLSDLVITSEECAKEVVFSQFWVHRDLIMCVMMKITLARLTLCVVPVR